MITWLRKRFIRDYSNINDPKVVYQHGVFGSIIGLFINIILIALKLTGAFLLATSQNWVFSMALLGDSINNIGDLASSLVTLISFHAAKKPADKEHPYGHQRMEYIASLFVGIIIMIAALLLLKESITYLVEQQSVSYTLFAYIVFGVSILLKSFQAYLFYGLSKATSSLALKGVAIDSLLDATSSTAILLSALVNIAFSFEYLDGILGILIALFVGYSSIKMIKESISCILGRAVRNEDEEQIASCVLSIAGVRGVHDLLIHEYGRGNIFVSLHIEVDSSLSLLEAHQIADEAEQQIENTFHYKATIHVDPKSSDPKDVALEQRITDILQEAYKQSTIHDFHVDGNSIHFDLLLPYSKQQIKEDDVILLLKKRLKEDYQYHIQIDHPYHD